MAGPVKFEHQPSAYHISQGSIGLSPVPCKAQFPGQSAAGVPGILFDQGSDKGRILLGHSLSAISDKRFHRMRL